MMKKRIVRRESQSGLDFTTPVLSRVLSARGVRSRDDLDHSLVGLLPPDLKGIDAAADILLNGIQQNASILIVGDFDADGATSCALMVTALRQMGARSVNYLVPDRFRFGYGLTPEIVEVALKFQPDIIVTVDNGIASVDGIRRANRLGIQVVVTDHHLPGEQLPEASAIVNPNQVGCDFPSKFLAGVGVAFYLLSVLRKKLRKLGWFEDKPETNLADFLDLVALGTVADVVAMDQNNRRLVSEGLKRIRAGRVRPGLMAMLASAGVDPRYVTSRDLAYSVAPRLNAAGRLQDMTVGIECLMSEGERADELAEHLDSLNRERREIEAGMRDQAMEVLTGISLDHDKTAGVCLYDPGWHQGVVGIVASRIKERSQRPVIAFADAGDGELKGSGRSVQGFHLRDGLDAIATRYPGLLNKFGGHAMAAGLSLRHDVYDQFTRAFDDEVRRVLGEAVIEQVAETDGPLDEPITIQLARDLETAAPWGQGFPEPEFDGKFEILEQRLVGERHLKMLLQPEEGQAVDGICFNHPSLIEGRYIECAFRIEVNRYRGFEKPQLLVTLIL
ncbi:MAG: single-stranded-DNA-specific exonuclease RecJ [Pseudomonadales bacterium]|nr:single-stranded-DNA-specific exonuclease RecJ [Pseudomonadales bacterium]MBO7007234.1 single-stranded-DNA-specific exonuclease RecJ [Pseudomonadales bacterium]